jgi:hypothetical protein
VQCNALAVAGTEPDVVANVRADLCAEPYYAHARADFDVRTLLTRH